MFSNRIGLVGLLLVITVENTRSKPVFVISANVDDIQNLARKFLGDETVDQINMFLAKATGKNISEIKQTDGKEIRKRAKDYEKNKASKLRVVILTKKNKFANGEVIQNKTKSKERDIAEIDDVIEKENSKFKLKKASHEYKKTRSVKDHGSEVDTEHEVTKEYDLSSTEEEITTLKAKIKNKSKKNQKTARDSKTIPIVRKEVKLYEADTKLEGDNKHEIAKKYIPSSNEEEVTSIKAQLKHKSKKTKEKTARDNETIQKIERKEVELSKDFIERIQENSRFKGGKDKVYSKTMSDTENTKHEKDILSSSSYSTEEEIYHKPKKNQAIARDTKKISTIKAKSKKNQATARDRKNKSNVRKGIKINEPVSKKKVNTKHEDNIENENSKFKAEAYSKELKKSSSEELEPKDITVKEASVEILNERQQIIKELFMSPESEEEITTIKAKAKLNKKTKKTKEKSASHTESLPSIEKKDEAEICDDDLPKVKITTRSVISGFNIFPRVMTTRKTLKINAFNQQLLPTLNFLSSTTTDLDEIVEIPDDVNEKLFTLLYRY